MKLSNHILATDLHYILDHTKDLWEEVRNQRLFITGGTGFFGCWLLESFVWANKHLNLNATMVVLTRDKLAFMKKYPHLFSESNLNFHEGDVRNYTYPDGQFSHIIHAAADTSASLNETNPCLMIDTIVQGTKHTLEFTRQCDVKKFLLVSSGAVYGKQPADISYLNEDYPCQPNILDPKASYAIGKYTAEHMSFLYAKQWQLQLKIARCFAFVGPYLPLDRHFAIGNFIRDALNNKPIVINSDGSSLRSYLYAADLTIWLWTILFRGAVTRPYNVGSQTAITIKELATLVSDNLPVKIIKTPVSGVSAERYVPDVTRAQKELGLTANIDLHRAIQATKNWHLQRQGVDHAN